MACIEKQDLEKRSENLVLLNSVHSACEVLHEILLIVLERLQITRRDPEEEVNVARELKAISYEEQWKD